MEVTFDSRAHTDPNRVKEGSVEEERNCYAVEKIVGHEN